MVSNDNGNNNTGESIDILGLPKAIRWAPVLLYRLSDRIPNWAATTAFFILLIFLIWAAASSVLNVFPTDEYEVRGSVYNRGKTSFPRDVLKVGLGGKNLFVTKVSDGNTEFHYEWIIKVPRSDLDMIHTLSFDEYDNQAGRWYQIGSYKIIPRRYMNAPHIILETDESFADFHTESRKSIFRVFSRIFTDVGEPSHPNLQHTTLNASLLSFEKDIDVKQRSAKYEITSQEKLIEDYRSAIDPIEQIEIREAIACADTTFILGLIDSLTHSLNSQNSRNIGDYSALLTEPLLYDDGFYRNILDDMFFSESVERLTAGTRYEISSIVNLLKILTDERAIDPLLEMLAQSNNLEARINALRVLEEYSKHPSNEVIDRIARRLETEIRPENPTELKNRINRTLKVLTGSE